MFSERDPYKSMGHDPRAPANSLRKIRHRSNPGETNDNPSSSICINCNQPYSQLETEDVNYCDECASLQIECLECRKKFIPKENSLYCHHCEMKGDINSTKEKNYLKEKAESDFNKINHMNKKESIDFKNDENIEESEWDNPLDCFEPCDNRPKSDIGVKQRKSRKKMNGNLSNHTKIDSKNKKQKWIQKSDPKKLDQIRDEYKISVSNIIFYCIYESTIILDVQDVIGILKGSRTKKIFSLALDELSIYSELSHCSEEWLNDFINELVSQNYLQIKHNLDEEVLLLNENSIELMFHKFNSDHSINDEDLVYKLLNSSNGSERAHMAYLLGETKDSQYVGVLCKSTLDKDGNVRRLSASALEKIGNKKAEDALINLLNDEKPQVRQYAAKALNKIGSKKSLEPLKLISDDPKPYVRKRVKRTLQKLKKKYR